MLRPTTHRDMTTTLFGQMLASPLLFAPIGVQGIFHQDREVGVAEMAREIGVPFVFSTMSSCSLEEVAEANGRVGVRWFQLYCEWMVVLCGEWI